MPLWAVLSWSDVWKDLCIFPLFSLPPEAKLRNCIESLNFASSSVGSFISYRDSQRCVAHKRGRRDGHIQRSVHNNNPLTRCSSHCRFSSGDDVWTRFVSCHPTVERERWRGKLIGREIERGIFGMPRLPPQLIPTLNSVNSCR